MTSPAFQVLLKWPHAVVVVCRSEDLHHLRLLGAARPQRPEDEQEQHQQDQDNDGDHRGVAGLGEGRRVRSLGRNHVGEVQHVAQRPANIAALNLQKMREACGRRPERKIN